MGNGRSSRGSVVVRFLAVLGALMLSGVAAGQAGATPTDRAGDPVVIKGSAVAGLNGIAPDQIVPAIEDEPAGKAKFKLKRFLKTLQVKAGKEARFKVRVTNVGDAAARLVVICVKGGRQKVPHTCSTSSTSTIGAGKSQTRKMKFRVKRSAKKGVLLKVRISVWAKGAKTVAGTVRIRVSNREGHSDQGRWARTTMKKACLIPQA